MTRFPAALLAALLLLGPAQLHAAGPPRNLKWAELMPPRTAEKPKSPKPFFAGREAADNPIDHPAAVGAVEQPKG